MADFKRPFITSVRPRPSMKYNFFLPRLTGSKVDSNNLRYQPKYRHNRRTSSVKLPTLSTYHQDTNKPLRRHSDKSQTTASIIAVKTAAPRAKEEEAAEEKGKFGFGVALRISNLISRIKRRAPTPDIKNYLDEQHQPDDIGKLAEEAEEEEKMPNQSVIIQVTSAAADEVAITKRNLFPNNHALSTVMPLPSEVRTLVKKPLLKTKSSNALNVDKKVAPIVMPSSSMREKALQRQASWGTLRNRLINAKITDAFSNIKFSVKGTNLQALRCIGEGGYAKVYEVFNEAKDVFALKVVNLNDTKVKAELMAEIDFLKELQDSSKVINMIDYEIKEDVRGLPFLDHDVETGGGTGSKSWLFVLMERGAMDLDHIIKKLKERKNLTPAKMRFYWEQMLEAVEQVHERGIIHADIKPSNFLLVNDELKIIDFGLACKLEEGEHEVQRSFVAGTKDYISPEVYSAYIIEDGALDIHAMRDVSTNAGGFRINVNTKSDVWALGIILYQWVYDLNHPYSNLPGGKFTKIKALTTLDVPIELDPLPDPFLMDTLRLCLEKRVENRPSVKELLTHPYLQPMPF